MAARGSQPLANVQSIFSLDGKKKSGLVQWRAERHHRCGTLGRLQRATAEPVIQHEPVQSIVGNYRAERMTHQRDFVVLEFRRRDWAALSVRTR